MPITEVTTRAFEMGDWEDVAELSLATNCQWCTMQMPHQFCDKIKQKLENSPSGMALMLMPIQWGE